jgi:hypothetical protein
MEMAQSFIPAMNIPRHFFAPVFALAAAAISVADDATDFPQKPPVKALSPADEA